MRAAFGTIVALTADHFEQLKATNQFTDDQAFELTCQFHWARVSFDDDE